MATGQDRAVPKTGPLTMSFAAPDIDELKNSYLGTHARIAENIRVPLDVAEERFERFKNVHRNLVHATAVVLTSSLLTDSDQDLRKVTTGLSSYLKRMGLPQKSEKLRHVIGKQLDMRSFGISEHHIKAISGKAPDHMVMVTAKTPSGEVPVRKIGIGYQPPAAGNYGPQTGDQANTYPGQNGADQNKHPNSGQFTGPAYGSLGAFHPGQANFNQNGPRPGQVNINKGSHYVDPGVYGNPLYVSGRTNLNPVRPVFAPPTMSSNSPQGMHGAHHNNQGGSSASQDHGNKGNQGALQNQVPQNFGRFGHGGPQQTLVPVAAEGQYNAASYPPAHDLNGTDITGGTVNPRLAGQFGGTGPGNTLNINQTGSYNGSLNPSGQANSNVIVNSGAQGAVGQASSAIAAEENHLMETSESAPTPGEPDFMAEWVDTNFDPALDVPEWVDTSICPDPNVDELFRTVDALTAENSQNEADSGLPANFDPTDWFGEKIPPKDIDATLNEAAGNPDTALKEPAGNPDPTLNEPAGNPDAALNEPAGNPDTAFSEATGDPGHADDFDFDDLFGDGMGDQTLDTLFDEMETTAEQKPGKTSTTPGVPSSKKRPAEGFPESASKRMKGNPNPHDSASSGTSSKATSAQHKPMPAPTPGAPIPACLGLSLPKSQGPPTKPALPKPTPGAPTPAGLGLSLPKFQGPPQKPECASKPMNENPSPHNSASSVTTPKTTSAQLKPAGSRTPAEPGNTAPDKAATGSKRRYSSPSEPDPKRAKVDEGEVHFFPQRGVKLSDLPNVPGIGLTLGPNEYLIIDDVYDNVASSNAPNLPDNAGVAVRGNAASSDAQSLSGNAGVTVDSDVASSDAETDQRVNALLASPEGNLGQWLKAFTDDPEVNADGNAANNDAQNLPGNAGVTVDGNVASDDWEIRRWLMAFLYKAGAGTGELFIQFGAIPGTITENLDLLSDAERQPLEKQWVGGQALEHFVESLPASKVSEAYHLLSGPFGVPIPSSAGSTVTENVGAQNDAAPQSAENPPLSAQARDDFVATLPASTVSSPNRCIIGELPEPTDLTGAEKPSTSVEHAHKPNEEMMAQFQRGVFTPLSPPLALIPIAPSDCTQPETQEEPHGRKKLCNIRTDIANFRYGQPQGGALSEPQEQPQGPCDCPENTPVDDFEHKLRFMFCYHEGQKTWAELEAELRADPGEAWKPAFEKYHDILDKQAWDLLGFTGPRQGGVHYLDLKQDDNPLCQLKVLWSGSSEALAERDAALKAPSQGGVNNALIDTQLRNNQQDMRRQAAAGAIRQAEQAQYGGAQVQGQQVQHAAPPQEQQAQQPVFAPQDMRAVLEERMRVALSNATTEEQKKKVADWYGTRLRDLQAKDTNPAPNSPPKKKRQPSKNQAPKFKVPATQSPMVQVPMSAGQVHHAQMGGGPIPQAPMSSASMGAGPMGGNPMGGNPMGGHPMPHAQMGAGPMNRAPMAAGPMHHAPMGAQAPMNQGPAYPTTTPQVSTYCRSLAPTPSPYYNIQGGPRAPTSGPRRDPYQAAYGAQASPGTAPMRPPPSQGQNLNLQNADFEFLKAAKRSGASGPQN
ncbi:hypothetical protein EJ06DRAFT_585670 [Trichodelitschia bisporula]|uniref:Uncharacterized protein n=1 Tax=Trichodelitschia bisporula TaxID=703511 RepID=A0A6G1HIM1_9PEZI|nr:hypothetical protein EJ06DRAFT_585670 [Trichodelitschia bisporula]